MDENQKLAMDHEVRIRLLETIINEIRYLIRAVLGTAVSMILLPILLHHFGLI